MNLETLCVGIAILHFYYFWTFFTHLDWIIFSSTFWRLIGQEEEEKSPNTFKWMKVLEHVLGYVLLFQGVVGDDNKFITQMNFLNECEYTLLTFNYAE